MSTTIKDFLKNYYPNKKNNPGYPESLWESQIGIDNCARRLRRDLASNPNCKTLVKLFSIYKLRYSPDDVLYILNRLHIYNLDQLAEWITTINKYNPDYLFSMLSGIVDFDIYLEKISASDLFSFIIDNFPGINKINWKDTQYEITNLEGLERIMGITPSKRYRWIKESEDCDDFVRIVRGWLSKNDMGNITIADCEIDCYNKNTIKYSHNILLAIIKNNNKLEGRFCEPQNGHIWKLTDNYSDPIIDKLKVRRLVF